MTKKSTTLELYKSPILTLIEEENNLMVICDFQINTLNRLNFELKRVKDNKFKMGKSPREFRHEFFDFFHNEEALPFPDIYTKVFCGISNLLAKNNYILLEMYDNSIKKGKTMTKEVMDAFLLMNPEKNEVKYNWKDYCKPALLPLSSYSLRFAAHYNSCFLEKNTTWVGTFSNDLSFKFDYASNKEKEALKESGILEQAKEALIANKHFDTSKYFEKTARERKEQEKETKKHGWGFLKCCK